MSKLLCVLVITAVGLLAVGAGGESRIVGGQNATKGQFPHHVQIRNIKRNPNKAHCSGSIIGDRFVLTVATCVRFFNEEIDDLRVIAGEVDRQVDAIQHRVDRVTAHPGAFNPITVVRVSQPFEFTANVRPIQLPTEDTPITNDGSAMQTTFVGWGQNKLGNETDEANFPQILQWMNTTAISHPECLRLLEGSGWLVQDYHICARDAPGTSVCEFDAGGGLISHGAQPVIIGLLSIRRAPCDTEGPHIYTRVFPFLSFIRSAMEQ